jgi:hypothetical protein
MATSTRAKYYLTTPPFKDTMRCERAEGKIGAAAAAGNEVSERKLSDLRPGLSGAVLPLHVHSERSLSTSQA